MAARSPGAEALRRVGRLQEADFDDDAAVEDMRAEADAQDRLLEETFDAGRREGRAESRGRRAPARRRRARRRSPTSLRAAGRQLRAPLGRQIRSGVQLLGLTLGVIALYLFLANVDAVTGFFGGIGGAVRWLQDPDRSIPYAPG